jgi:hypothetical protein
VRPTILQKSFEACLCDAIVAGGFRFSGPHLSNVPLVVGRHLFAKAMPEASEITRLLPAGAQFDPRLEPVTAFFDTSSSSGEESSSSFGGKLTFLIEAMTRLPKPGDDVTRHSRDLVEWMKANLVEAMAGQFRIKGVVQQGTPGGLERQADGMIFASSRVRFLAVSLT